MRPLIACVALVILSPMSYGQESKSTATQKAPARNDELRYQLKVPKGWDYWVLADSAGTADSCYTFASDPLTKDFVESHIASGTLKTYQPGEIGILTGNAKLSDTGETRAYCIMIVSGKDKGAEGWVSKELIELTPESKKVKADRDAAEAARQKQLKAQLRAACASVYKTTIDKKIDELTVRESDQIKTCRALGLYPP